MDTSISNSTSVVVKLRAALIPAGQGKTHFSRTLEIWQHRALLLCPVNLPTNCNCQLFLEVPANSSKTAFESIEIQCTVQFSVLVGQLDQYRIGVKFTRLVGNAEAGLQRLFR